MKSFIVPPPIEADAYQLGHYLFIPPGMRDFQVSQGIARKPLHWIGDERADNRLLAAGIMPFTMLELDKARMTMADVDEAEWLLEDFHAKLTPPYHKPYPFPRAMFERIVTHYDGRWPVCVMALPDGHAHYVGEPHVQIWTDEPGMGEAVGWLESTLGPYVWASMAVATRGRIRKDRWIDVFRKAYPSKSDEELAAMVAYCFHDFGRRGGAASQITGIAHLYNWLGTDTMDAVYAAVCNLNDRRKFGACSVAAAAHRTITPHRTEDEAINQALEQFGDGIVSIVADTYNYEACMRKLAGRARIIEVRGGRLVGRPDSGDPVECVLKGLEIFGEGFGYTLQETGLRVLKNSAILQGDGVSDRVLFEHIFPAMMAAGWCPSNLVIGMGEYNHRAVRSDTEWGYKTAMVGVGDGLGNVREYQHTMKRSESAFKRSLPMPVALDLSSGNRHRVVPISVEDLKAGRTGALRVVYDGRNNPLPLNRWSFDETRELAWRTWREIPPNMGDTVHPDIRRMQDEYMAQHVA